MTLLRAGLLEGRSIVLAGEVPPGIGERLSSLGATLSTYAQAEEEPALEWARSVGPVEGLVCATGALETIEQAWVAVRALANGALIPAGTGAIVLLAPRPGAVAHADAVRAAVENLARTLSVEWARYGITATVVAPGSGTREDDLATVVAFLCSPAGAYCSGCRIDLDPLE